MRVILFYARAARAARERPGNIIHFWVFLRASPGAKKFQTFLRPGTPGKIFLIVNFVFVRASPGAKKFETFLRPGTPWKIFLIVNFVFLKSSSGAKKFETFLRPGTPGQNFFYFHSFFEIWGRKKVFAPGNARRQFKTISNFFAPWGARGENMNFLILFNFNIVF